MNKRGSNLRLFNLGYHRSEIVGIVFFGWRIVSLVIYPTRKLIFPIIEYLKV